MGDLNSFNVVSLISGKLKLPGPSDLVWRWVPVPVGIVIGNQPAVMLAITVNRLATACPPWPTDEIPQDLPIDWAPEVER